MMNESTPAPDQGVMAYTDVLDISWACDAPEAWHEGNAKIAKLIEDHGLIELSAGTGFGRRDIQMGIPDWKNDTGLEALQKAVEELALPEQQHIVYPEDDEDFDVEELEPDDETALQMERDMDDQIELWLQKEDNIIRGEN